MAVRHVGVYWSGGGTCATQPSDFGRNPKTAFGDYRATGWGGGRKGLDLRAKLVKPDAATRVP
jgi:hypothetical protein